MRIKNKENLGFFVFFSVTILVMLWKVVIIKSGFVRSDYFVQFFPWSQFYAESVKNFNLPYWCRYFHSGFPLMAEGQTGGFYPLNMAMFFALPFKIAYNYSLILHFIIAGVSTYLFTRKLGADQWGGSLAALLFCFGSAYAGCFYNVVTLKTLSWFPLVLLLTEKFSDSKKFSYILLCGIIAGMEFLAGFIQMAVYAFGFYVIYMLYNFKIKRVSVTRRIGALALFSVTSFLIALPQLLLTYRLAQFSSRASASLGFALWKSFPLPCIISSVFPYWLGFFGPQLYIGVLSILFLIYAVSELKREVLLRPIALLGILSFLFALGRYNPVYVAFIKVFGLYGFRNPSKFLFFSLFSASVLAGFGFSRFFESADRRLVKLSAGIFSLLLAIFLSIFFLAKMLTGLYRDNIISALQDYVVKHVYGKPHHRYDLDIYMQKVRDTYSMMVDGLNLTDFFIIFSLIVVIAGLLLGIYILTRNAYRLKRIKGVLFCLIFLDIFVYSFYGTGFRGNIEPFKELQPSHKKILHTLKSDTELFRFLPFGITAADMPGWAKPNANILYKLDSVGAYTPLAEKGYKSALLPLEAVDDSLGVIEPSNNAIVKKLALLRLLNVKYIVTPRNLKYPFLEKLVEEDGVYLYKLEGYLPRFFFAEGPRAVKRPVRESIEVVEYKSGFAKINVESDREGFVFFSENYYPGWHAFVDDTETKIIPVRGLIQSVRVGRGRHEVIFRYAPDFFKDMKE